MARTLVAPDGTFGAVGLRGPGVIPFGIRARLCRCTQDGIAPILGWIDGRPLDRRAVPTMVVRLKRSPPR